MHGGCPRRQYATTFHASWDSDAVVGGSLFGGGSPVATERDSLPGARGAGSVERRGGRGTIRPRQGRCARARPSGGKSARTRRRRGGKRAGSAGWPYVGSRQGLQRIRPGLDPPLLCRHLEPAARPGKTRWKSASRLGAPIAPQRDAAAGLAEARAAFSGRAEPAIASAAERLVASGRGREGHHPRPPTADRGHHGAAQVTRRLDSSPWQEGPGTFGVRAAWLEEGGGGDFFSKRLSWLEGDFRAGAPERGGAGRNGRTKI